MKYSPCESPFDPYTCSLTLSIYLVPKPVGVECTLCIRLQSSILIIWGVICTPPPTLFSCQGFGPAQVRFLGSCGRGLGVQKHEAQSLFKFSESSRLVCTRHQRA